MSSIAALDDASRALVDASQDERVLRVILGPTAAGKSRIALDLAAARGLGIVSADSRQVYRGFDIGTAKPTAAEQALVPHRGIDVLDPVERYSAHAWAADAERWSEQLRAGGAAPVVVGGTGFYVRALVSPLAAMPLLDADRRAALEAWLDSLDAETLARWCTRLDPIRGGTGRTQQLRAVETALLSGRRISDAHAASPAPSRPVRYLVVDPGAVLAGRIEARVHRMVAEGWLEEVRALMEQVPPDAPAWNASGYETLRQCVLGVVTQREAVERVVIETRQYAKRQRTWCRHQLHGGAVTRLNPDEGGALERALRWWDGNDGDAA